MGCRSEHPRSGRGAGRSRIMERMSDERLFDLGQVSTHGRTIQERLDLAASIASNFGRQPLDGASAEDLADAERRLKRALPPAVAQAYVAVVLSPALNAQDHFLDPSQIEMDSGYVVFRRENQGCASWGWSIDDVSPDPMIAINRGHGWTVDAGAFSSFVVFAALSEAVLIAPNSANAPIGGQPSSLASSCREIRIEPFEFWPEPGLRCHFFGGSDTLDRGPRRHLAVGRLPHHRSPRPCGAVDPTRLVRLVTTVGRHTYSTLRLRPARRISSDAPPNSGGRAKPSRRSRRARPHPHSTPSSTVTR